MFSTREIWEAGRKALGLSDAPATRDAATSTATAPAAVPADSDVFDPAAFTFEQRTYRIHFKNGYSGEYEGAALATFFPFDPAQIESIQPA